MRNLRIKKLLIDNRVLIFQPGLNFIVGPNASGKTTIFNCMKYVLGISIDMNLFFFQRIELVVEIGGESFQFVRASGSATLQIHSEQKIANFRARSAMLDDFYQEIFQTKFAIGNKLTSIFPILEFCFISNEIRLNSKSLWSALRLICGSNDRLLVTASKDMDVLHSQIQAEKDFLEKNEKFIESFLEALDIDDQEIRIDIQVALDSAREKIVEPLQQKSGVLKFSLARIEELRRRNERNYSDASREIEQNFIYLIEGFPFSRMEAIKFKDVIARDTGSVSHGQAVLADFVLFLSIARTRNFSELNFPNIYINDGLLSRSVDKSIAEKAYAQIETQVRNDDDFQYIEFVANRSFTDGTIVADLSREEWRTW